MNPKTATTPTLRNIEWAAGFLEGEGSFGFHSRTQRADAWQVQKEPLERLQRIFGGSLTHYGPRGNKSPIWCWHTSGPRARGIMLTLFPLMSPKRQGQIKRALKGPNA